MPNYFRLGQVVTITKHIRNILLSVQRIGQIGED